MSKMSKKRMIEDEIALLQKRADERWNWLMKNTESRHWNEVKRDYNAIVHKIDNRKKQIANLGYSTDKPDYTQVYSTNNIKAI